MQSYVPNFGGGVSAGGGQLNAYWVVASDANVFGRMIYFFE